MKTRTVAGGVLALVAVAVVGASIFQMVRPVPTPRSENVEIAIRAEPEGQGCKVTFDKPHQKELNGFDNHSTFTFSLAHEQNACAGGGLQIVNVKRKHVFDPFQFCFWAGNAAAHVEIKPAGPSRVTMRVTRNEKGPKRRVYCYTLEFVRAGQPPIKVDPEIEIIWR